MKLKKFFRLLISFVGPGYLVAVGYMDPGNWATDIAGGSKYNYALLSVILASSLMAMLLQHLSLKLGIVTGEDLAVACKKRYGKKTKYLLWILAEIAITACDLAEVIGAAIALKLIFHLPIIVGVILTAFDVVILHFLQSYGFRVLERAVIVLVGTIIVCFGLELILSHPSITSVLGGFIPTSDLILNRDMLYIAIGILGATVMPHNLYLHSSLVQQRLKKRTPKSIAESLRFASIDSNLALTVAFLVNCSILILAASVFYTNNLHHIAQIEEAHELLSPLLGSSLASLLFAIALLASGHSSTITGTLAGQIVMEGFINIKIDPKMRRLLTRLAAILPAIFTIIIFGDQSLGKLLVLSQVVLSLQLPFAVIPLVIITSDPKKMGKFVNTRILKSVSWTIALIITLLNLWLIYQTVVG